LHICQAQLKLWSLNGWFVDPVGDKEQLGAWSNYQNIMGRATEHVKTKGLSAITIAYLPKDMEPTLFKLNGNDLQGLAESGTHAESSPPNHGGKFEVLALGLEGMHCNSKLVKAWQKDSSTMFVRVSSSYDPFLEAFH
jgi:hypothetical protein